jgi:hypothetical protein
LLATLHSAARPPGEFDDWVAFYVNLYVPKSSLSVILLNVIIVSWTGICLCAMLEEVWAISPQTRRWTQI